MSIDDAYRYIKAGMEQFTRSTWDIAMRKVSQERLRSDKAAIKAGRPVPVTRRPLTASQKLKLYGRQHGLCWECKQPFHIDVLTDDHIEPVADGGDNQRINRRLVCGPKGNGCNREKSDRTPFEHSKATGKTVLSQYPPPDEE